MSSLAAAGATSAAGSSSTGGGFGSLLLLALPLLLLVYLVLSQRRRQRRMKQMQAELSVGDEVMTTTGLYGRIVHMDHEVVHLEAAPGTVLRWDKRAVVQAPAANPTDPEPPATDESKP